MAASRPFQVFLSHASADEWVAKQLAKRLRACGAKCFLDAADLDHGDDFDAKLVKAARASRELLVLLTPWAIERPFVWLEVGAFWGAKKRIVVACHGLTAKEITENTKLPISIKKSDLVALNEIETYFSQLRRRITAWTDRHA